MSDWEKFLSCVWPYSDFDHYWYPDIIFEVPHPLGGWYVYFNAIIHKKCFIHSWILVTQQSNFHFKDNCTSHTVYSLLPISKFTESPNHSALESASTSANLLLGISYCYWFNLNHWVLELPISLVLLRWDYVWYYKWKIASLGNSRPPPYQRGRWRWLEPFANGYCPLFTL